MNRTKTSFDSGRIANRFIVKMAENGFGQITSEDIDVAVWKTGEWPDGVKTGIIKDNEVVFNLGADKGRSNFFVFMKMNSENIEVFYTDPRSDEVALTFTREDLYKRYTISGSDSEAQKQVKKIITDILTVSQGKFEEDYRMQTHHHAGYFCEPAWKMMDDGSANLVDVMRKAILYHTDVWNPTPHNSSDLAMHGIFDAASAAIGMIYVPGLELTAIKEKTDINGPHILLMFDGYGQGTAEEIVRRRILAKRKDLKMISFFSGMAFDKMELVLQELRARGALCMMYAHEMNNAPELQLRKGIWEAKVGSVGLFSAVELGAYSLEEAIGMLKRSDGIANFNPTLSDNEMIIRDNELMAWVYGLMSKYRCGELMTANACNMAIARWAEEEIGIGSHFESDEHDAGTIEHALMTGTFYGVGGDGFAKGFTRLLFKPELFEMLKKEARKPTAKEIVQWISSREIRMRGKVFAEMDSETGPKLAKARTEHPRYTGLERILLKARQIYGYAIALIHDAWHFATHKEWKRMFNLDK